MTSSDRALVDTNVLVYAVYPAMEHHAASKALLDRAQAGEVSLCVTQQVLAEFFAVVTNARRVSTARQPEEALDAIEQFLAMPGMDVLPVLEEVSSRWITLVRQHPVTGGGVFDVQLAATMLVNGVHQIYTFNRPDFEQLGNLQVLEP